MLSSDFLDSLSEQEMGLLLYFINIVAPPSCPKMTFEISHLKWLKKDILIDRLLKSFDKISVEGHSTYKSLLEKLGVNVEIRKEEPKIELPTTEITGSVETNKI